MLDLELFTSYIFWTPNYQNTKMVSFPGIFVNWEFKTLDSKSLSPRDPESRNVEMPKCSSKGISFFMISELLMWITLLLVNRNAEMLIPKILTNILP
jgi:hypothetical protein